MSAICRLIVLATVLAIATSGIAFAETTSDHNASRPGQAQEMTRRCGEVAVGSPEMQQMMHQRHSQHAMPMGTHAGLAESPYAGQQSRSIKALSEDDIAALQNGDGMGTAKAAELNSYPGPRHVLSLAKELRLTEGQADQMTALRDRMSAAARPLGAALIDRERSLDQLFAKGEITPERLTAETEAIGDVQGRLRAVHLAAHLETRAILTSEQVALYDKLRGYTPTRTSSHDHTGEHQH